MKTQHGFLVVVAMAVIATGLSLSQPLGATDNEAREDTGADQIGAFPHGCADCHTAERAGTIGSMLAELGHPEVDDIETVPDGCVECHSEDGGFWPMDELTHLAHYGHPPENAYLRDYGANCLHCHAMDLETGAVTIKSGPMNR